MKFRKSRPWFELLKVLNLVFFSSRQARQYIDFVNESKIKLCHEKNNTHSNL
jgi:hypothetical protein